MDEFKKIENSNCEEDADSKFIKSKHLEGLSVEEKRVVELISNIFIKFLLDENFF